MTVWQTLKVAIEALSLNKLRSFLTTLGVIIGVAAVILMLAVSAGAEAEIADQINALGANLILVSPTFTRGDFRAGAARPSRLEYADLEAIRTQVTGINGVSAEQHTSQVVRSDAAALEGVSVVGTTPDFPKVRESRVAMGRFLTEQDLDRRKKVAVLGHDIAEELFGEVNPIGRTIKIGSQRFTVV
ncbi:MAG: ABC transporter permease, partial [Chloroflexia bacterium]